MRTYAVPMSEESYGHVPELLRERHQSRILPSNYEFTMLRCWRDDAAVLLSVSKPVHWATAPDERRDKVMVAAIGESVLRSWRIPSENRLRRQIIELLRPHGWQPG
jgi:hypothetical protein